MSTTGSPTAIDGRADPTSDHRRDPEISRRRQLGRVVSAEWIKARSVPTTWSALGATTFIMVAVGAAVCVGVPDTDIIGPGGAQYEPLPQVFAGVAMSQVALGVLGALLMTTEYSSRSITSTLTAIPQRRTLLAGKAALLTAITAPVALSASGGAVLAGLPVLQGKGLTLSRTDPQVVRAVLGTALVLTLTALLGLAVGTLLRSTAAAVLVLAVVLFLVPVLIQLLPTGVSTTVGPWTPSQAGAAVLPLQDRPEYLDPAAGLALAAAYTTAALVAAAVLVRRRDA